jgi:preprotein translocase subunit YajC
MSSIIFLLMMVVVIYYMIEGNKQDQIDRDEVMKSNNTEKKFKP